MADPIEVFAAGARDGAYPGGQIAASRECRRLVTASVGLLGPGLGPTHNHSLYDLASLTKPLATAILAFRAAQDGLCKLEDPAAKFVPGVDSRISLLHLLEHSSGYPAHVRFDRALPRGLRPGTWDAWEHIVFQAVHTPKIALPGERAEYSDVGYIILGAALEVIFAQTLSASFAQFGTPLFFRDRRGPPSGALVRPSQPFAPTENCQPGEVHDENARAMGGAAGHAGLFGTAEGVLLLAEHLLLAYHGWSGGILSPSSVRRMWQPSTVPHSTRTAGWDRPSAQGSSTGGRWPLTSVGHLGFTGTSLWIDPESTLAVVLVTNRVCPTRANNLIRQLRPALHDAAWVTWGSEAKKKALHRYSLADLADDATADLDLTQPMQGASDTEPRAPIFHDASET